MKLTRHTNRYVASLLMGVVLFAQGVVSAHACSIPGAAVAQAAADMQAMPEHDSMQGMPCSDNQQPSSNVCESHCSQAEQISTDQAVHYAAPVNTAVLQIAIHDARHVPHAVMQQHEVTDTGPPLSILFCSFLN